MGALSSAIMRPREGVCSAQDYTADRVGIPAPWGQSGVVVSVPCLPVLGIAGSVSLIPPLALCVVGGGRAVSVG